MKRADFFVVGEHFPDVLFDDVQNQFIAAIFEQFRDFRPIDSEVGSLNVFFYQVVVPEQCINGVYGDLSIGNGGV